MCPGQNPGYLGNNMSIIEFKIHPGENILYHATPIRKWYVITWKIFSDAAIAIILSLIIHSLLAGITESALTSVLPAIFARVLTQILFLGVIPLGITSWAVEDVASTLTGEFILTDQRIWIHGSPHAWSQSDTLLEDISSLTWHRDAIFVRNKSSRKIQVHMFSEGKLFAEAYKQYVGRS
jgi:hypothetical protein